MRTLALFALLLAALVGVVLLLRLLNPLPDLEPRTVSAAFPDTEGTRLGQQAAAGMAAHPGLNGVLALPDAREALAARIAIARAAERSIDAQYYIWHGDISGNLLFRELIDAADRGVRVRLLLDDNGTVGLDRLLAALDKHPMIEVRLFNPFVIRQPKLIGYAMDLRRLNRRMHNKAFIADNQAVVIGGRNVGDEYFGASDGALFEDLDVFAVGPIVGAVSADFDRYWASQSSHRVATILPPADAGELEQLKAVVARAAAEPLAQAYAEALARTPIARQDASLPLEWTRVTMVSDDPAKGLGQAPPGGLLAERLARIIGRADERVALVSAYFVPTAEGTAWFAALARKGVDVRILTNALESTDVAAVHAGYAPHRPALLDAGVTLWELKAEPGHRARLGLWPGSGGSSLSSSRSSLHAKTFAVDGNRIFIGSFNFDPRSVALNTELGFLIESPTLAQRLHAALEGGVAPVAYRLRQGASGIEWVEDGPDGPTVHATEPGTHWGQRAIVRVMGWLPIEGFL